MQGVSATGRMQSREAPPTRRRSSCCHPRQALRGPPRTNIKGADARLGALQQVGATLQGDLAALCGHGGEGEGEGEEGEGGDRQTGKERVREGAKAWGRGRDRSWWSDDVGGQAGRRAGRRTLGGLPQLLLSPPLHLTTRTFALTMNQWPQRTSVSISKRTW